MIRSRFPSAPQPVCGVRHLTAGRHDPLVRGMVVLAPHGEDLDVLGMDLDVDDAAQRCSSGPRADRCADDPTRREQDLSRPNAGPAHTLRACRREEKHGCQDSSGDRCGVGHGGRDGRAAASVGGPGARVDRVAGQGVDIVADLSDPEGRRCVVEQVAARAAASLVVGATVVIDGGTDALLDPRR